MNFNIGEIIVYHKMKHSKRPGPRAKEIHPSEHGDDYSYIVDKFWKVVGITETLLRVRTRCGKEHTFDINDKMIRKIRWYEKIFFYRKIKF